MKRVTALLLALLMAFTLSFSALAENGATEISTVVPDRHSVTVTCGTGGSYEVNGTSYTAGETFGVERLGSFTVTAVPNNGYTVQTITTDSRTGITINGNVATIAGIYQDIQITLTFENTGSITVPVQGGDTDIKTEVTIDENNTITVTPPTEENLNEVITDAADKGTPVEVDLSGLTGDAEQVVLPSNVIDSVAASASEGGAAGLTVKLPDGSGVEMDAAAIESVAQQTNGDSLTLVIAKREPDTMSEQEQIIFDGEDTAQLIDLKLLTSNGTEINDFAGGRVKVTVTDVELSGDIENYVLLSADGSMTNVGFTAEPIEGTNRYNITFYTKQCTSYALIYKGEKTSPFRDVKPDDWFFEDVLYVHDNGLMDGTAPDLFSPYWDTTRGMIVTILYRMEGQTAVNGEIPFEDVEAGRYYEKPVIWAASHGIILGYDSDHYGPEDFVTREQLAAIMYRYAEYKQYDTTKRSNVGAFRDSDKISEYAVPAISWAIYNDIIRGREDKTLAPTDTALRSEVAAILHRFCTKFQS